MLQSITRAKSILKPHNSRQWQKLFFSTLSKNSVRMESTFQHIRQKFCAFVHIYCTEYKHVQIQPNTLFLSDLWKFVKNYVLVIKSSDHVSPAFNTNDLHANYCQICSIFLLQYLYYIYIYIRININII